MSNFKFQSDSINTETAAESEAPAEVFKFQSDSINTLIRHKFRILASSFKFQSDSINTKMSTEEWLDERL